MSAAILKLNRGSIVEDLHISEPFFEDDVNVLHIGTDNSGGYITLLKLNESNDGSLNLTGDVIATNAQFSGDVDLDGDLYVGGDITLGDGGDDIIFVGAPLSGSLIPVSGSEFDLGSVSRHWRHIYADSATITNLTGSFVVDFDDINNKPTLVSGSSQIDHNQTFNYLNDKHIDHSNLNVIAGNGLSGGGILTISRTITLDTNSVHFISGVKSKMDIDGVISSSAQLNGTTIDNLTVTNGEFSGSFSGSFYGDIIEVESAKIDTSVTVPHSVGQIRWGPAAETLIYDTDEEDLSVLLVENSFKIKNDSGVAITKLSVVHPTGATGSNPKVELATASTFEESRPVGLIRSPSINDGAIGYVTIQGKIGKCDTTGAPFGETWIEGQKLYLSTTPGYLTKTKPAYPAYPVRLGVATRSHATEGIVIVDSDPEHNINQDISVGSSPAFNGANITGTNETLQEVTDNGSTTTTTITHAAPTEPEHSALLSDIQDVTNSLTTHTLPKSTGTGLTDSHITDNEFVEITGRISIAGTGNSVFLGIDAGLHGDLTANENTFIGAYCGKFNDTGEFNAAYGTRALQFNVSGSENAAFGDLALYSNTIGEENAAIGHWAGRYVIGSTPNQTSSFNTYLGGHTKASVDGSQNETVVGYLTEAQGNNTVTLGHLVTDVYMNDTGDATVHAGSGSFSGTITHAAPTESTHSALLSDVIQLGITDSTAYRGDRGLIAYEHSQITHAPADAEKNVNADWVAVTGDAEILNKPTTITTTQASNIVTNNAKLSATGTELETSDLGITVQGYNDNTTLQGVISLGTLGYTGDLNANEYVHPTSDGNKHVPANSTTNNGKVLTSGAVAGVYTWEIIPTGVTDHTLLSNIGVNTHIQIDSHLTHPLVQTAVPIGALFTDTIYDDTAIQAEVDLNTAKTGITTIQANAIVANTAKVTDVAHPIVQTEVPIGALFTDTIYDDTSIQAEVTLNTAKVGITTTQSSNIVTNNAKLSATGNELESTDINTLLKVNTIITDATLIDTGDSRLSDARTPLTHTQAASTITDFDTEVSNNTSVVANTAKVTNVSHPIVETAVPVGALFTDTVYTHPTHTARTESGDTGALTGATVISDLDFNMTSDTKGHITSFDITTLATRDLTLGNLGYTGATDADKYTSWTIKDGDTTTYTITSGDQLTILGGTGITSNFTADDVLTITNTSPNVTTNITVVENTTTVSINSSDGTDDTIAGATATLAGVVTNTTQTFGGTKTFNSTITGNISGNAGSATVLQTARTIAGVSFNGSANISLNNNAITNGAGYITDGNTGWTNTYGLLDAAHTTTHPSPTVRDSRNKADFTENSAFNKDFGTVVSTVCQGNDSRLSDNRTPIDNSVTPAKAAAQFTDTVAMSALNVDWDTGFRFTKTITADSTLTFSNLHEGVKFIEITGDFSITFPSGFTYVGGERAATGATIYQLICSNSTTPSGYYSILKDES